MIVVPFVAGGLHPATERWARDYGAHLHELSRAEDAYWRALVRWWAAPGDLVIVEQDIVPAPGVVEAMLGCEHSWCVSPYEVVIAEVPQLLTLGFGCTRFSSQLKAQFPDAMARAGLPTPATAHFSVCSWRVIDVRLAAIFGQVHPYMDPQRSRRHVARAGAGAAPHVHEQSPHLR